MSACQDGTLWGVHLVGGCLSFILVTPVLSSPAPRRYYSKLGLFVFKPELKSASNKAESGNSLGEEGKVAKCYYTTVKHRMERTSV